MELLCKSVKPCVYKLRCVQTIIKRKETIHTTTTTSIARQKLQHQQTLRSHVGSSLGSGPPQSLRGWAPSAASAAKRMALLPRRPRTVAVQISQQDYVEALQTFRGDRPLEAALGGIYVDDMWKTPPAMVTALHPLLTRFIDNGG